MNSRGIRPYFFSGSLLSDCWLFFQNASGDLRPTVLGGTIAEADLEIAEICRTMPLIQLVNFYAPTQKM